MSSPTSRDPAIEPEAPGPDSAAEVATAIGDAPMRSPGHDRLLAALRPRASRPQVIVAVLCALLGFALVAQVRSQRDDGLTNARQSDLVGILDTLNQRSTRLADEIRQQQETLANLTSGANRTQTALQDAQLRAKTLGILAGTAPATGTGIVLRIDDPSHSVTADIVLDVIEELRDAGAEAAQISGIDGTDVRLVASSYVVDIDGGIDVDGVQMKAPYALTVIGDPHTLAAAMGIPGGVLETLRSKNAAGTVDQHPSVTISALRALSSPQYARPSPLTGGSGDSK